MSQKRISVVVDTNFLLKQINLRELLPKSNDPSVSFEEQYEILSLYEVLNEVKDAQVSKML